MLAAAKLLAIACELYLKFLKPLAFLSTAPQIFWPFANHSPQQGLLNNKSTEGDLEGISAAPLARHDAVPLPLSKRAHLKTAIVSRP